METRLASRKPAWLWIVFAAVLSFVVLKFTVLSCGCAPLETANRVKCANNLKLIGLSIAQYASTHGGEYPDSFASLLECSDLTPAVFDCPSTDALPAPGKTDAELAAELNDLKYCSYIYLGRGLGTATVAKDTVVAYEPLSNHAGHEPQEADASNILFADGHVELDSPPIVQMIINQSQRGVWPVIFSAEGQ
jgi:prepilin-type processing-associated H-X9-DG protein